MLASWAELVPSGTFSLVFLEFEAVVGGVLHFPLALGTVVFHFPPFPSVVLSWSAVGYRLQVGIQGGHAFRHFRHFRRSGDLLLLQGFDRRVCCCSDRG